MMASAIDDGIGDCAHCRICDLPSGRLAQFLQPSAFQDNTFGSFRHITLGQRVASDRDMTPEQLRARLAAFAAAVDAFAAPLLASPATRHGADQLMRASSSASSNYRAAGRARSHAEFTAKVGTALEEADESLGWIEHLLACKRVTREIVGPLVAEADELVRILAKSHQTARQNGERDEGPTRPRRRRT